MRFSALMAAGAASDLTPALRDELLLTYAAFILKDADAAMSAENLNKLITTAGGSVDSMLPKLFAKMLAEKDLGAYITAAGTPGAGGGGGGGAAAPAAGGAAPAKEEAEKEEVEEEEEEDMDFDLFG